MWEKTYGGERYEFGNQIIPASDGGFVILGETESFGAGGSDIYLLKVDEQGTELWSRTFGGPEDEMPGEIHATADGDYIIVGGSASFGNGDSDVYVVRTDASGNEIWSQSYGESRDQAGIAVHENPDGSFFICGLHSFGRSDSGIYFLQVDEAGTSINSRVWSQEGKAVGFAAAPTADGNYLVTGPYDPEPEAGNKTKMDFLFLKVSPDGSEIWSAIVGNETISDYGMTIAPTSDGGFVAAGMSMESYYSSGSDIPVIKVDENGQVVWQRMLNPGDHDAGASIVEDSNGDYVIVGFATMVGPHANGTDGSDIVLIKLDKDGNIVGE
jgi:hypothetical protein